MKVMGAQVVGTDMAPTTHRDIVRPDGFTRQTVDLILDWLRAYEQTNTLSAYRVDAQQFCQWLNERTPDVPVDLLAVDRPAVDLYARHLKHDRGLKPATVARKLASLASLYTYAVTTGRLPHSPIEHVRRPKVSTDGTTRALTVAELLALLDAARAAGDRDYALVTMLVVTAARMSEVISINVEEIRPERGHWVVPIARKGKDRELIPLPHDVHEAVQRLTAGRTFGPVFLDRAQRPMDRFDGKRVIRRLARAGKLPDPDSVTPHSLRASYATTLLSSGKVPSHRVREGMSHASLMTTERYLRSADQLDQHANYTMAELLADARLRERIP